MNKNIYALIVGVVYFALGLAVGVFVLKEDYRQCKKENTEIQNKLIDCTKENSVIYLPVDFN